MGRYLPLLVWICCVITAVLAGLSRQGSFLRPSVQQCSAGLLAAFLPPQPTPHQYCRPAERGNRCDCPVMWPVAGQHAAVLRLPCCCVWSGVTAHCITTVLQK